jgi:hypothetical protein
MADDLPALRRRIAELKAERQRIERAPLLEKDALARIEPDIARLGANLPPITVANLDALLRARPAAVLARLLPEAVAQAIAESQRETYAASPIRPMSPSARARELARIEADLRTAEIAEETFIRAAEASGVEIDRRADATPAIVLLEQSK